jgi:HK97 family phage portal protein
MWQPYSPHIFFTSANGTKSFSAESGNFLPMVGDSRPADRLSIEQAYERVAFLRRCVDLRAEAFAGIPFTIRRKTTGAVLYDSEQFKAPNDNLKWCAQIPDLLRLQEIGIVLYGRAYWRPLRRPDGWVNGIQHLYTGSIEEVYSDNGEVVGFKRLITNPKTGVKREVPVPFNEVIAFYNRSPLSEVDGHAPMPVAEAARINSDVLYSLDKWLDSFMDRGLLPATILSVPANTPPADRANFQTWWDKYFRGKNNAGRQKVLNADAVTVTKIGDGLSDLGNSAVVQEQRENIAAVLAVPMSHVLSGAANRATAFQEDENLYTKGILPRAKRSQNDLNEKLFDEMGLYFRFEFDRIKALQRANLETARSLEKITDLVIVKNEARNFIGLEPVEGGDEFQELNPQMAPAPAQADEFVPLDEKALGDIQKWRYKVENKGYNVPFESDDIPPYVKRAIRMRLDTGESAEDAFTEPFYGY